MYILMNEVNKSSMFIKYKSTLTGITGPSILHINDRN